MAQSRARTVTWTVVAEASVREAVKRGRALGDASPITAEHLWERMAQDIAAKPYKALGMGLVDGVRRQHEEAVEGFMHYEHLLQSQRADGRQHGVEIRVRLCEEGARAALHKQITALNEALARNSSAITELGQEVEVLLQSIRKQTVVIARRGIEAAKKRSAARAGISPSPHL